MKVVKLQQPLPTGEEYALVVSSKEGGVLRSLLGQTESGGAGQGMYDEMSKSRYFDLTHKVNRGVTVALEER